MLGVSSIDVNKCRNELFEIHNKKGKNDSIYERIYIKKESLDNIKPLLKEHMHESASCFASSKTFCIHALFSTRFP